MLKRFISEPERNNKQLIGVNFHKITSVCRRYPTLLQHFMDFSPVLGTLGNERKHQYIMSFARRDIKFEVVDDR